MAWKAALLLTLGVGLPEQVDAVTYRRAGDEIMGLQQPIDRSLGDKVFSVAGEAYHRFARRQLWKLQWQMDDLAADIVRDAIPDPVRL